jgi:hypothetical protein
LTQIFCSRLRLRQVQKSRSVAQPRYESYCSTSTPEVATGAKESECCSTSLRELLLNIKMSLGIGGQFQGELHVLTGFFVPRSVPVDSQAGPLQRGRSRSLPASQP